MKAGTTWLYELFRYFTDIWRAPVKELHFLDVYGQVGATTIDQRLNFDVNRGNQAFLGLSEAIWRPELNALVDQFDALKGYPLCEATITELKWWRVFLFGDRDWSWYDELFRWPSPKSFVDITPTYDACPDEIISLLSQKMPHVRIIFLLRNPLSRLVSHFCWGNKHKEPVAKLISDWKLFQKLLNGRDVDYGVRCSFEGMLAHSSSNENLKKWVNHIPENRIFVGFLDDIVNHQDEFISSLADFLVSGFVLPSGGFLPPVNSTDKPVQVDSRVIEWLADWSEREARALNHYFGVLPQWWAQDIARLRGTLGNNIMEWDYKGFAPPNLPFSSGVLSYRT